MTSRPLDAGLGPQSSATIAEKGAALKGGLSQSSAEPKARLPQTGKW